MRGLLLTILAALWAVLLVLTGGRFLPLLAGANQDSEQSRSSMTEASSG